MMKVLRKGIKIMISFTTEVNGIKYIVDYYMQNGPVAIAEFTKDESVIERPVKELMKDKLNTLDKKLDEFSSFQEISNFIIDNGVHMATFHITSESLRTPYRFEILNNRIDKVRKHIEKHMKKRREELESIGAFSMWEEYIIGNKSI